MITETTVLIACFGITFCFIGYKLSFLVKNKLDSYIQGIADKIKKSENIKIEAIKELEQVNNKNKLLQQTLERMNKDAKNKIEEINENLEEKLNNIIERMIIDHKKKIQNEKEEIITAYTENMKNIIKNVINECVAKNLNEEDKKNAIEKTVEKIDFNKFID